LFLKKNIFANAQQTEEKLGAHKIITFIFEYTVKKGRMPRQARIDAPGALHHIIVRGIERRRGYSQMIRTEIILIRA
jgi:hypothetical protein